MLSCKPALRALRQSIRVPLRSPAIFRASHSGLLRSGKHADELVSLRSVLRISDARSRVMKSAIPRHQRGVFTEAIVSLPTPLIPPLAFAGFFATLWIYKCVMLVIFQNKIIYMPGLPPGARQEKIEDYSRYSNGVIWQEERISSLDGTDIALAVGTPHRPSSAAYPVSSDVRKRVTILYFQGYAESITFVNEQVD